MKPTRPGLLSSMLLVVIAALNLTACSKGSSDQTEAKVSNGNAMIQELNTLESGLLRQGVYLTSAPRSEYSLNRTAPDDLRKIQGSLERYIKVGNDLMPIVDSSDVSMQGGEDKATFKMRLFNRIETAHALSVRTNAILIQNMSTSPALHPRRRAPTTFEVTYFADYSEIIVMAAPAQDGPKQALQQRRRLHRHVNTLPEDDRARLKRRTLQMLALANRDRVDDIRLTGQSSATTLNNIALLLTVLDAVDPHNRARLFRTPFRDRPSSDRPEAEIED